MATLGASSYTYAEAQESQAMKSWIGGHVRAFEYFGGVAEILVPDNTKTAITSPCRYEPDINPTYQDMAEHSGTAVIPTIVRHPRDNGKVERSLRTDQEEFYQLLTYIDDVDLNEKLAEWERFYNIDRPHGAFNGKTPYEALRCILK